MVVAEPSAEGDILVEHCAGHTVEHFLTTELLKKVCLKIPLDIFRYNFQYLEQFSTH